AVGGAVGDDARHGVAAALVVAEDLGEEAPESRDRAEHPVPVLDAMLVEGVVDPGLGQDVGEREALVAREAGTEPIQARPRVGLGVSGRDYRDDVGGKGLVSDHTLSYVAAWTKVHCTLEAPGLRAKGRGSIGGRGWCPRDDRAPTGESSKFASSDDRPGRGRADASHRWSPRSRKAHA